MPNDRDKLLQIMDSLESDYADGKISPEKYSYFRSKYEDKLNSIDAKEATRRIRSMQGKSSSNDSKEKKAKRPTKNNKEKEQDLVQKYIINPKKDDAKYNKRDKESMDSGTFKLLLLLVLVLGFTVGVGYGVFNLDFDNISETTTVAIVTDTAFPEINEVVVQNTTPTNSYYNYTSEDYSSYDDVETTEDTSYSSDYSSSSSSGSGSYSSDYSSSSSSGNSYSSDYSSSSSSSSSESSEGGSEE